MTRLASSASWGKLFFHHITQEWVLSPVYFTWHAVLMTHNPLCLRTSALRGNIFCDRRGDSGQLNLVTDSWTHAPPPAISIIRIIAASITPIIVSPVEMPRLHHRLAIVRAAHCQQFLHSSFVRWSLIEWILNAWVVKRTGKSWVMMQIRSIFSLIEYFPGRYFKRAPAAKSLAELSTVQQRALMLAGINPFSNLIKWSNNK